MRTFVGPLLDPEATDAESLLFLGALVTFEKPKILVEAGTYLAHGSFVMACSLDTLKDGHLWTADPVDRGVQKILADNTIEPWVTYCKMDFEEMLAQVPRPIDFAFIDATEMDGPVLMRLHHLNAVFPLMRPGGLIVAHDTGGLRGSWGGRELTRHLGVNLRGPRGLSIIQTRYD